MPFIPSLLLAVSLVFSTPIMAQAKNAAEADPVTWLQTHSSQSRVILLGEKHGTREIPRFVAAFIRAQPEAEALTLGLEVWRSEQTSLDEFLDADDGSAAGAALRESPFWRVSNHQHDGRRSEDMLELIDAVRQLRQAGRDINLLAYDLAPQTAHDHHSRDRMMAEALRAEFVAHPERRLLVLTGNVHAMQERPGYAPPEMQQPMGSYLADLKPLSVNIEANRGEFWGCRGSCDPIQIGNSSATSRVEQGHPYDLRLVLPEFSVARLLGKPVQDPN